MSDWLASVPTWVVALIAVAVGWVGSQVTEVYRARAARKLSADQRLAARTQELLDFQRDTLIEFRPALHEWVSLETQGQMIWTKNLRANGHPGHLGEKLDQLQLRASVRALHIAPRVADKQIQSGFEELRELIDALDQKVIKMAYGQGVLTEQSCLDMSDAVRRQYKTVATRIDVVLEGHLAPPGPP